MLAVGTLFLVCVEAHISHEMRMFTIRVDVLKGKLYKRGNIELFFPFPNK